MEIRIAVPWSGWTRGLGGTPTVRNLLYCRTDVRGAPGAFREFRYEYEAG